MPQSMVHISNNDQREFYYNALIKKISEFKRFINAKHSSAVDPETAKDIAMYLREAISFKNMFDVKSASFSITRDDVNLLTRILNTSA